MVKISHTCYLQIYLGPAKADFYFLKIPKKKISVKRILAVEDLKCENCPFIVKRRNKVTLTEASRNRKLINK